jgi:acyl-CoA synthetase (NDP forming)
MVGYLEKLRSGLSLFVSSGNEADLDMLDYLDHALTDGPTRVVALLMDSIKDGIRFRRLAMRAVELGKHIVVLKIGMSEVGAQAAVAHSSRLAGNAAAYRALFESCSVSVVGSLEELMTTSALLALHGKVAGGAAMLTTSGAGASMLADLAEKHGLPLPALRPETHARIARIKSFSRIGNPVDVGSFERGKADEIPSIAAADPDVGAVVALINPIDPNSGVPTLMADLVRARQSSGKPLVVIAPGGFGKAKEDEYIPQGLCFVPDTEIGIKAAAAMLRSSPTHAVEGDAFPVVPGPGPVDAILPTGRQLTEPESLALLASFGIPVVPTMDCGSLDEALAAAERIGWPVVVKGVAEGVAHKTEAGLVRLDVRDRMTLERAFEEMGRPSRLVVQPFLRGYVEAIAGLSRSPDTGPMLLVGLGGVYAEALREVAMIAIPASRNAIEDKISGSALGRILASPRWNGGQAKTQLVEALLALQSLALWAGDRLGAVDVNPIVLSETGAVAVDGLVVAAAD